MILGALYDYYQRKTEEPGSLAPLGFEFKEIPFVVLFDKNGKFVPPITDMREGTGKSRRAKVQLVPQAVKRSVGVAANLFWDSVEYALGADIRGKPERVREQHRSFRERITDVFGERPTDEGVRVLLKYLDNVDLAALRKDPAWSEIAEKNPFISFRMAGDTQLVSQRPVVLEALRAVPSEAPDGICVVTGRRAKIARLHPAIKGVRGGQSTGGNVVSFNLKAFESYGKEQGANAPVGKPAAFAYTTALNHLLGRESRQKMTVGDSTIVFWSEKASGRAVEDAFADWFDPPRDNPDANVARVKALFEFQLGKPLTVDDDQRFYVLGLAPNAARISVRFWQAATIRHLGQNVFQHFEDLSIVRPLGAPEFPSLYRLLSSIAVLEKAENIPPTVAGDWMRAILAGSPYPLTLLQAAIRRSRAEREVGYLRASLIKGSLNRTTSNAEEKITVSLDTNNVNVGYRLGRLFATFEKIQEEASPGLNATIRDRYYGSASASPIVAFPILNRLKNHHLAKLDNRGRAVNFERLIGEIIDGLDGARPFPPNLSLGDQGRFAVGYYHQRQSFFKTKEKGEG